MMATLFGNVSCSDSDEEPIAVAVTGVKVDKESVAIKPDAEVTLVATITPSDAANKEVSWTSSNTGVVLVDNTGKVKGVAEGEATVTVKTADGSFAASTKVTVDINAGERINSIPANAKAIIAIKIRGSLLIKLASKSPIEYPNFFFGLKSLRLLV